MTKPALLSDIVDAFYGASDETNHYLNKENGKVYIISDEEMSYAEDDTLIDDLPDWQREDVEIAKLVLEEDENLLRLPDQFDLNERSIMLDFTYSLEDTGIKEKLLQALNGKRPYRRFKDTVIDLGLDKDWYAFLNITYIEIAKEWCKDHDVEYE
jgi:hypothetical protein